MENNNNNNNTNVPSWYLYVYITNEVCRVIGSTDLSRFIGHTENEAERPVPAPSTLGHL